MCKLYFLCTVPQSQSNKWIKPQNLSSHHWLWNCMFSRIKGNKPEEQRNLIVREVSGRNEGTVMKKNEWWREKKQANERKGDSFSDEQSITVLFQIVPIFKHMHRITHNNPAHFTSPSERGINEWSDRHRESMDPFPREGNALIRTDVKTTTSPLLLAWYLLSLSVFPFPYPSISFHPDSQPPSGLSPASSRSTNHVYFSLATPYSSSFFVCPFDCSVWVCCLLSLMLHLNIGSQPLVSNCRSFKRSSRTLSHPFDHIFMSLFMSHKYPRSFSDPVLVSSTFSFSLLHVPFPSSLLSTQLNDLKTINNRSSHSRLTCICGLQFYYIIYIFHSTLNEVEYIYITFFVCFIRNMPQNLH